MKLEGIMLNETSQTENDKYHMLSLTCGIQKKKENKFKSTENRSVAVRGKGWVWGKCVQGVKRYKLPVMK